MISKVVLKTLYWDYNTILGNLQLNNFHLKKKIEKTTKLVVPSHMKQEYESNLICDLLVLIIFALERTCQER